MEALVAVGSPALLAGEAESQQYLTFALGSEMFAVGTLSVKRVDATGVAHPSSSTPSIAMSPCQARRQLASRHDSRTPSGCASTATETPSGSVTVPASSTRVTRISLGPLMSAGRL